MLAGLRIVEIGEGMAVQVAGLLLAEVGADVLKIERPGGDPGRGGAPFANWNRGKRSLLADLDTAAGSAALRTRLGDADVLLHQFTPERARARGLDDDTLAVLNPRLVVCGITGSPHGHPDVERSDDELLVAARLGKLYENDGYRPGPIVWRYRSGGWAAAHLAAGGVLARLVARLTSGRGGPAHSSIMQGMLSQLPLVWARNSAGPMPNPPTYAYDQPRAMAQQLWQCADGDWLQIMDPSRQFDYATMPTMWEVLAEGADLSTEEGTAAAFRRRPLAAWLADLRAADIAAEPAYPLGALLYHEDARANEYLIDLTDTELGPTTQPNTPFHTNRPLPVRRPAPARGEGGDRHWSGARPVGEGVGRPPAELLDGVRVLDLGMFLAGPMAPSLMGDIGADVIKVEALTGDRIRFMHRYYQAAARSKRSIALDLTKPDAQPILERLIRWAEVLHHNLRFKGANKLGLSEENIRRVNPDIVFSYVSAYGQRGQRAGWPGYDSIFTALAGIEFENAGEGNRPVFDRPGPMDVLSAQNCFVGTMAALYAARASGEAWTVQTSLLGVSTLVQGELLLRDGRLTETYHLDREQTGFGPYHRIYECRDRRWIAVAAHRSSEQAALHAALGDDEATMVAAARGRAAPTLLAELEAAGVPCDLVVFEDAMNRFFDDPVNRALNLVSSLEQPLYGTVEQPGAFWNFGDTPVLFKRACPAVGEHSDEIMRLIGYDDAAIADFRARGVIG